MRVWILGGGTFGVRAAEQLARRHRPEEITLVDPSERALARAQIPGIQKVRGDGVDFLHKNLGQGHRPDRIVPDQIVPERILPDWIVPALPVHLVWEWAVLALGEDRLVRKDLPRSLVEILPNAMTGDSGDIYVSHADFLCPADCSEPARICTSTGKPRKEDLFRFLERVAPEGVAPFVIRSRQLGPGLGGVTPQVLFDLLERLRHHQGPCFLATACRCHGVVTGGNRR